MLNTECIYLKNKDKVILSDINISVQKGECLGLVGPNGSGKSSLLKILAFLQPPSSGRIWFQGLPIPKQVSLEIRRKLAIVFQESLLLDTSVWENVAIGLKIRGISKAEIQKRTSYWLEQFGVLHLASQSSRSLSGGEAQRVSLARALALEPDILYLDEPFSALDAPTKETLRTDLAHIFQTTQITTIMVSHDFEDIGRFSQRALLLLQGRIVADGPPTKLLSDSFSSEVNQFLAHWRITSNRVL